MNKTKLQIEYDMPMGCYPYYENFEKLLLDLNLNPDIKLNLRKKIKLDIYEEYANADNALIDLGYETLDNIIHHTNGNAYSLYLKDGQLYAYRGMDYINGYIYNITLSPIE